MQKILKPLQINSKMQDSLKSKKNKKLSPPKKEGIPMNSYALEEEESNITTKAKNAQSTATVKPMATSTIKKHNPSSQTNLDIHSNKSPSTKKNIDLLVKNIKIFNLFSSIRIISQKTIPHSITHSRQFSLLSLSLSF